ncbi:MAG: threonine/serine exporter ThrE family protein [Lachnospiraceae bacterium]
MQKGLDTRVNPKNAKNDYDPTYILSLVLDIGEEMLTCGAEINRVEDSIYRMLTSYGYQKVNVFSIPEFIAVSIVTNEGETRTQTRRVYRFSNNFHRLEELNEISRQICATQPGVKKLWQSLDNMQPVSYHDNTPLIALGYFMGGGAFTIFFGGNVLDGVAAGITALLMMGISRLTNVQNLNKLVYTWLSSLIAGFSAILFVRIGIGQHLDTIMIGDIMLLIPGMALTTSIRDMMCGDLMAGIFRFLESLLVAGSIALGYAIPLFMMGGII